MKFQIYDLIQTHDCKLFKKTEMLSVNMLFLPCQVVGTGFRTVLGSLYFRQHLGSKDFDSKASSFAGGSLKLLPEQNHGFQSKQMMPTACLFVCVYLYTFIHIHTLYTYVSFVIFPQGFQAVRNQASRIEPLQLQRAASTRRSSIAPI